MPVVNAQKKIKADNDDPLVKGVAVTPSDTDELVSYFRSIYVGVTGDVKVVLANDASGAPVTFKAMPVGFHPICVKQILSTGTTATNIIGLN